MVVVVTRRQHRILRILKMGRFPTPSLADLADDLEVAIATVRRDLIRLESAGLVRRGRGARSIQAI